jgi:S1-C subfamily serine protease
VLADLAEVWVEDPATPGRRLAAIEVASLEDPEVTLLKCDGLAAAPLPLGEKLPAVAAELAAANKAGGLLSGEPVEVRRGAVVAAVRSDVRGAFVHSVAVSRGFGGGPIVDATGRLVGLVAPTPRTDATGNTRGLGIPVEAIWPLLKEQLADLTPAAVESSPPAWEVIEARLAPATVRVVGVEKRVQPKAE